MKLLVVYDQWCEDRIKALLLFLEEWLSISQMQVERGLILIYLGLVVIPPPKMTFGTRILLTFCLGSMMWFLHRRPSAVRTRQRIGNFLPCFRVGLQILVGTTAVFGVVATPHFPADATDAASQIVYLIFFYMIDICSGGERGRRRKLAWAKIKELFGTEWIPKPVPVPQ